VKPLLIGIHRRTALGSDSYTLLHLFAMPVADAGMVCSVLNVAVPEACKVARQL